MQRDIIDTGYFHGMFGYVGADGVLRPSKYSFEMFLDSENKKKEKKQQQDCRNRLKE